MTSQAAKFLKILFPFLIWVYLFRGFFLGSAIISQDTFTFYASVKFYLNNLIAGVYPLWDPSVLWGAPAALNLRPIGEFNPFLFLILIFDACGMSFYQAFVVYLALYYLLGLLGFYALVNEIFKDKKLAYLGYVFLMFSSFGMTVFSVANLLLLFVPAVWFFYFLARLLRAWRRPDFLALVFCLMIIMTTYLPFYFLVVFIFSAINFLIFYFRDAIKHFKGMRSFIRANRIVIAGCVIAIGIAAIIPVGSYLETVRGEILTPARHPTGQEVERVGMAMRYEEINNGGLATRTSLNDLVSQLDRVHYQNDGFFYLPIICFVILWAAIFNIYSRRFVYFLCLFVLLFLLSLAELTPLHRALFSHVPFFKLFRNLYYFLPFLLAIMIFLTLEGLDLFLKHRYSISSRRGKQLLLALVFGAAFYFLFRQPDVIQTSIVTLGIGYLLGALYFQGVIKPSRPIVAIAFFVLVILQPCEVLNNYHTDATRYSSPDIRRAVVLGTSTAHFSYLRPEQYYLNYDTVLDANSPNYAFNFARLSMTDFPGFIPYRCGFPTAFAFSVFEKIDENIYRNYVKNKIILYDDIMTVFDEKSEQGLLSRAFGINDPAAVVFHREESGLSGKPEIRPDRGKIKMAPPRILKSDSDDFLIKEFTVNSLTAETNFEAPHFLVYNDSFHSDWKAFVNGKKTDIFRANGVFKGLWVPAGKSQVDLRFDPAGGQGVYFFVLAFFLGYFVYVLNELFRGIKNDGKKLGIV